MAKKENPSESPTAVEPFVDETAVRGELAVISEPWDGKPLTEAEHPLGLKGEALDPDDTIPFGEPGPEPLKTAEAWHAELETEGWEFAAAKAHHQWPEGREMTAAQYQAAVATASGVVSR